MSDTTLQLELDDAILVTVNAKITSLTDEWDADRGEVGRDEIRSIRVEKALIHTSSIGIAMPSAMIVRLGLIPLRKQKVRTPCGVHQVTVYWPVRLSIQDREFVSDVCDLPSDGPLCIGRLALLGMDLIVDPEARRLVGNPAHDGKWVWEAY